MERLPGEYPRAESADCAEARTLAALPLAAADDFLDYLPARAAVPDALHRLGQLEVLYDEAPRALWSFMRPAARPSFTPDLLGDFEEWQRLIAAHFGATRGLPLDYLVLGSRAPGVFCFGGDLDLFQALIRAGDRAGLAAYGHRCVAILHRNLAALDLPIVTIGLVQGQALGGGFEALLSFDEIVAERGAGFGLPEGLFGLFPGMGAHSLLTRRLGSAAADRIILSNRTYSAEEMHELGIVTMLAEPGEGVAAVRRLMAGLGRRVSGRIAARRAARLAAPVTLAELGAIVEVWADAALLLGDGELRLMNRLAAAQLRRKAA